MTFHALCVMALVAGALVLSVILFVKAKAVKVRPRQIDPENEAHDRMGMAKAHDDLKRLVEGLT